MCGRQTIPCDNITDHGYEKHKAGFIGIMLDCGVWGCRTLNFCPSCSQKSYTIEELKTIGNHNQWSY